MDFLVNLCKKPLKPLKNYQHMLNTILNMLVRKLKAKTGFLLLLIMFLSFGPVCVLELVFVFLSTYLRFGLKVLGLEI
jgi:hypothetical protein